MQRNCNSPYREFHSVEMYSFTRYSDCIGSFQSSIFLQSLMDCPIERNNVGRFSSLLVAYSVGTGISAFNQMMCLPNMTTYMIVFEDMVLVRNLSRMRE